MSKSTSVKIAVLCDKKLIDGLPFHVVGDKYLLAITEYMQAEVVMLPAHSQSSQLLDSADGLMLTGSISNIEPHHYGEDDNYQDDLRDPERDEFSFELINKALQRDIPILGICRGFQELNVALGGAMYQRLAHVEDLLEHRENSEASIPEKYDISHEVELISGGILANALKAGCVNVNSLHMQGVKSLGDGLVIEAVAPDGLIEAFRLDREDRFALGIQWHPEWQVVNNPDYQVVFDVFLQACSARK